MKPRSARVARRVMRSARLRDELAAAKWELRKLERVRRENATLYVLLADAYARIAQREAAAKQADSERAAAVAKLEAERDERRRELWAMQGEL